MSIAAINKVSDYLTYSHGDTARPRINVNINGKPINFLFDTGAAITCMPLATYHAIFGKDPPKTIGFKKAYAAANGQSMINLGQHIMKMSIRGRTYEHTVQILDGLTDCVLGIDFMHKFNATYNPRTRNIVFDSPNMEILTTTHEETVQALSSKIIRTRFHGTLLPEAHYIASIISPQSKTITGMPQLVKFDKNNVCSVVIDNCSPVDIVLPRRSIVAVLEMETSELIPLEDSRLEEIISSVKDQVKQKGPTPLTKLEMAKRTKLNVPVEYKQKYIDLLFKHHKAISVDKHDLGLHTSFKHKIHLKDSNPVYRKQFKIPEAHQDFIEATLEEWLKLGVVRRSNSLYNSPIFCVPKKQGQGLRIVQDFRALNLHTHIDKYSMKEIHECIGDIGRAGSTIFSTLDLTSGFWQMPLDEQARPLTAFTIPARGQFEWITSPMGLLGCPASFQRLMEQTMRGIKNCIVYIDDLLVHSSTHEDHLNELDKVLTRLENHNLKINLEKCIFGNTSVNYLGFVLTPKGITPGSNKLKAIQEATPPTDVKMIRSFLGLCNFFRTHIKDFAIIASPLYKCTRQDSTYKGGTLPADALSAFYRLQRTLISEPVMAYPRQDRKYALITDASTGSAQQSGGLGAILTQIDTEGQFHAISFASRQLKDHEKNYSPFLLEAAAAVWGMETFHEYLKGKNFILYTDHKPLEKLGHLHTKTLNRLQTAMLEYDFLIQYKKGSNMPADFLSRQHQQQTDVSPITEAFDPFQPDLKTLQQEDEDLQHLDHFLATGQWNPSFPKSRTNMLEKCAHKLFQDKNKVVWIRLSDFNYPRTALWLPNKYRKMALCEAHNSITGGHDAAVKTYMKISNSYWWPNMYQHISEHTKTCEKCQLRKTAPSGTQPLQPLPIPDTPNIRIHADLFGPMTGSDRKKKWVLCMTDAFTKYAVVTTVEDKTAETVARAIFEQWFCKFGLPAQIHTDGGSEFCNKLSGQLFTLLNVQHTTTSPAHPQCNAQVEVFNKTVKKYLASFVDDTTTDWEQFLPALMLSYNTSYHSTIATTPFELLFGVKARLPSFPNPDIQKIHYGENFASERMNILNKARQLAHQHAQMKGSIYKAAHDANARPHKFKVGQKVLLKEMNFLNKNAKLSPKWQGPYKILDLNDNNACLEIKNKSKIVNVQRIKPYFEAKTTETKNRNELDLSRNKNLDQSISRPFTRAMARLQQLQDSAQMAMDIIQEEIAALQQHEFSEAENTPLNNSTNENIHLINPTLKDDLMKIAYKLLTSPEDNFKDLTPQEQNLWKTYPNSEIFELITGVPDAFPEFRFDWITPSATLSYKIPGPTPAENNQQGPPQALHTPGTTRETTREPVMLRDRKPINYKETKDRATNFKSVRARAAKRCQSAVTKVTKFLGSPSPSSSSSK